MDTPNIKRQNSSSDQTVASQKKFKITKDPFDFLPYNCQYKILEYIKSKDILNMCQVCQSWKDMIENDHHLMERAMSEIVLKLEGTASKDLSLYGKYFEDIKMMKGFKHMSLNDASLIRGRTIFHLSQSLVSLSIMDVNCNYSFYEKECNFPHLKNLEIIETRSRSCNGWLLRCRFPSVTNLVFKQLPEENFYNFMVEGMLSLIIRMPMLKHFYCRKTRAALEAADHGIFIHALCHLDSVDLNYLGQIALKFSDTIKSLKLVALGARDCELIFEHFVNLERFSVKHFYDQEGAIPLNKNITKFEVEFIEQEMFKQILLLMPNLETIVLYISSIEEGFVPDIHYLAHNMMKLKYLIIYGIISEEAIAILQELKESNILGIDVNTDFEIIVNPYKSWDRQKLSPYIYPSNNDRDDNISLEENKTDKETSEVQHKTDNEKCDPFRKLTKSCSDLILNHLTTWDMLKMRTISKPWKIFVDSSDKFISSTQIKVSNYFDMMENYLKTKSVRNYKHLEIGIVRACRPDFIKYFVDTLESLKIDEDERYEEFPDEGFEFPQLKKLSISLLTSTWLKWLSKCEFPKLTEFSFTHIADENVYVESKSYYIFYVNHLEVMIETIRMLTKMPNLKKINCDLDSRIETECLKECQELVKIITSYGEKIEINIFPVILEGFDNSLKVLDIKIECISIEKLRFVLENFKHLQELSLKLISDTESEYNLSKNKSVKRLKLFGGYDLENSLQMNELYEAIPNLEELTLNFRSPRRFGKPDIKFIAMNLLKLKKIAIIGLYSEDSQEICREYSAIEGDGTDINTSIEFDFDDATRYSNSDDEDFPNPFDEYLDSFDDY